MLSRRNNIQSAPLVKLQLRNRQVTLQVSGLVRLTNIKIKKKKHGFSSLFSCDLAKRADFKLFCTKDFDKSGIQIA